MKLVAGDIPPSFASRSRSMNRVAAEWKTPMKLRDVRRPSGLVHIAGPDRSWLVKMDTFKGLFREVRRDTAVPNILLVISTCMRILIWLVS